jgi:hypothetical protein
MNRAWLMQVRTTRTALAAGMILVMAACQSGMQQAPASIPARMSGTPSDACLTQLTAFASQVTQRSVTLTQQAFAQSSQLLLERPPLRGPDGKLLDGRSLERPEALHLLKQAGTCAVLHEGSNQRAALPACACTAAN